VQQGLMYQLGYIQTKTTGILMQNFDFNYPKDWPMRYFSQFASLISCLSKARIDGGQNYPSSKLHLTYCITNTYSRSSGDKTWSKI